MAIDAELGSMLFSFFKIFITSVWVQLLLGWSLGWSTYIDKPSHCVTFIIGIGIHIVTNFLSPHLNFNNYYSLKF